MVVDVEAGDTRNHHYGLAVDYGSTTMIMQLVDLNSGCTVGEAKTVNGQTSYGSDILTRITYALEDNLHLGDLHRGTIDSFHRLLADLTESTGVNAFQCPLMVVSGNTTMIHFLLKLDAWSVFASPYAPIVTDPGFYLGGELGMDFSHVVRTWIYADRILTWYGELNRARDAFFREKGVYDRFVPASTGIGWTGGSGARIVLGAYAVKAKRPGALTVAALPSPLQCPALAYGSSFSRAAEVGTPAWTQVVVSGTAAIHPGSHDVAHVGDVDAQIGCTMKAVEAIYASRGFSLSDVTSALVYLKRPAYRENWEAWLAAHPGFPRARAKILVADVCRDEWLFEIESEALKWK
jgi:enamine deaminase RidA (YjgF/YER057c/UK114 family)